MRRHLLPTLILASILGILALIAIPNFQKLHEKAYDASARSSGRSARLAMENRRGDKGTYRGGDSLPDLLTYDKNLTDDRSVTFVWGYAGEDHYTFTTMHAKGDRTFVFSDGDGPAPSSSSAETGSRAAPTPDRRPGMAATASAPPAATKGRKLVREGELTLRVGEIDPARADLEAQVAWAGGFVSDVSEDRSAGNRSLRMTVRVPAEGFLPFLDAVRRIGFVQHERYTVEDVTDRYFDVEGRAHTKEALAARLERLIADQGYQFQDLLQVEQELARLREEIDGLRGSLRGLDDRIALSTLRITMTQEVIALAVPPDSVFAPLVGAVEDIGPRFKSSVHLMMEIVGFLVSVLTWLAPWIALLVVVLVPVLLVRRRRRARGRVDPSE